MAAIFNLFFILSWAVCSAASAIASASSAATSAAKAAASILADTDKTDCGDNSAAALAAPSNRALRRAGCGTATTLRPSELHTEIFMRPSYPVPAAASAHVNYWRPRISHPGMTPRRLWTLRPLGPLSVGHARYWLAFWLVGNAL